MLINFKSPQLQPTLDSLECQLHSRLAAKSWPLERGAAAWPAGPSWAGAGPRITSALQRLVKPSCYIPSSLSSRLHPHGSSLPTSSSPASRVPGSSISCDSTPKMGSLWATCFWHFFLSSEPGQGWSPSAVNVCWPYAVPLGQVGMGRRLGRGRWQRPPGWCGT